MTEQEKGRKQAARLARRTASGKLRFEEAIRMIEEEHYWSDETKLEALKWYEKRLIEYRTELLS